MFESSTHEERSKDKVAAPPPPPASAQPRATDTVPAAPTTIEFTPHRWAVGDADEGVL